MQMVSGAAEGEDVPGETAESDVAEPPGLAQPRVPGVGTRATPDRRKNTGQASGSGSAPGDTEQFLLTLTPAVSAGGLSLIGKGSRA